MSDSHLCSSSTDIQNSDAILTREIYVHHRGPSCKQHTTFLQKSTGPSASLPANQGGMKKKSSSSHEKKRRGHTWDGGWGFKDGRARPSFIPTREISLRHITSFSTSWIFFLDFFFTPIFVKTKD